MFIPKESGKSKIEIKKSIFISELSLIKSTKESQLKIKSLWKEHPQARHIVWAYQLGKKGEIQGKGDDGEPSGTAGNPTLSVLQNGNITAALLTTIRYFGGIKLGTGGLVRAYTKSAQAAFQSAQLEELIAKNRATIILPYSLYDNFNILLKNNEAKNLSEKFTEQITIEIEYPISNEKALQYQIKELTKGGINLKKITQPPSLFKK